MSDKEECYFKIGMPKSCKECLYYSADKLNESNYPCNMPNCWYSCIVCKYNNCDFNGTECTEYSLNHDRS